MTALAALGAPLARSWPMWVAQCERIWCERGLNLYLLALRLCCFGVAGHLDSRFVGGMVWVWHAQRGGGVWCWAAAAAPWGGGGVW